MMFVGCIWVQHPESFFFVEILWNQSYKSWLACEVLSWMDRHAEALESVVHRQQAAQLKNSAMQCHAPNCKPGSPLSQLSWYHLQQSILGIIFIVYFSKTRITQWSDFTHDITLFCQQFSPHFRFERTSMVRPPSNWWAALMAACWDAFRKLRTNLGAEWSSVAPGAWNIMERDTA